MCEGRPASASSLVANDLQNRQFAPRVRACSWIFLAAILVAVAAAANPAYASIITLFAAQTDLGVVTLNGNVGGAPLFRQ